MQKRYDWGRLRRHVLIFLIILILGLLNLKAQQNFKGIKWTGAVDSTWEQAGNWSTGRVPNQLDDVAINNEGTAYQPVIVSVGSCRTLLIEKGAQLKCDDNSILTISGDFKNSGRFIPGTASVIFASDKAQDIQSHSALAFFNLVIDNESTVGVVAKSKINIANQLTFVQGCVTTHDTVVILSSNEAAIAGYSETKYLIGPLQRKINNTSEEKYFFPVGTYGADRYFPASIEVSSLEKTQFITVSFNSFEKYIQSYSGTSDDEMTYEYIAPEGMWTITPDVEPAAGWYDLRLWTKNMTGLIDNMFSIVKHGAGGGADAWTANFGEKPPFGGEGRKLSDGFALKKYCNSFAEFAIAGGGAAMQANDMNFDARFENGTVKLAWSTATETGNSFFIVEKSNGTDFKEIAKITGSGNSSVQKSYSSADEKPFTGVSYYRLKQTSSDGRSRYSKAVSVKNEGAESQMIFFPNPAEGIFKIRFLSPVPNTDVIVYSQQGTISLSKSFTKRQVIEMNLKDELLAGVYYMQISTGSENLSIQKILIE